MINIGELIADLTILGLYPAQTPAGVVKTPCVVSSLANLTATYANGTAGVGATLTNSGAQAAFTVDGVTPAVNARILIPFQTSTFQNGIYILTTVGSGSTNWVLTRAPDFDGSLAGPIVNGAVVTVTNGTVNAGNQFQVTSLGPFTVGTTPIIFTPFNNITASTGLFKTGGAIGIANTGVTGSTAGDAAHVPAITYNLQGQLLNVVATLIAIASTQITDKGAANGVAALDGGGHLVPTEFPSLGGDISVAAGSTTTALATVLATPGAIGASDHTLGLTADAKGRITAIASALIAIASSQITDKGAANGVATLNASALLATAEFPALTGDVTNTAGSLSTALINVLGTPGSIGAPGSTLELTGDAKGRITAMVAVAIAIASTQITDKAAANGVASLTAGSLLTTSQFPALTGDVTNTAGALGTTIQPAAVSGKTAVTTPALTDTLLSLQGGVLFKETLAQIQTLFQTTQVDTIRATAISDNFTAADADNVIEFTHNTGNVTCTISSDTTATIAVGKKVTVIVKGNGTVTFSADTGVTVGPASAFPMTNNIAGQCYVFEKAAANTWFALQTPNYLSANEGTIDGVNIGSTVSGLGTFTQVGIRSGIVGNVYGVFVNSNTVTRSYTTQDRTGTLADLTDIAGRLSTAGGTLTGLLTLAAAGLVFGTANSTALTAFEETTATLTLTPTSGGGFTGVPFTAVLRRLGKQAWIRFPVVQAANTNAALPSMTITGLPARFTPVTQTNDTATIQLTGTTYGEGNAEVLANNTLIILPTLSFTGTFGAGTIGLANCQIEFDLN